jgi:hypothetical protein
MIKSITFSKKTMAMHGTLVISIPPEIIEDMELSGSEMVEVRLTKKPHVQDPTTIPYNTFVEYVASGNVKMDIRSER